MKYKVIKDRQGEDFMVGTIGDYSFWLDWFIEDTKQSNAEEYVKEKQISFANSVTEEELIDFIDRTWEMTIVPVND